MQQYHAHQGAIHQAEGMVSDLLTRKKPREIIGIGLGQRSRGYPADNRRPARSWNFAKDFAAGISRRNCSGERSFVIMFPLPVYFAQLGQPAASLEFNFLLVTFPKLQRSCQSINI